MNKILLALTLLVTYKMHAFAKCVLPNPDSSGETVATYIGKIVSIDSNEKSIVLYVKGKEQKFNVDGLAAGNFFTSFGGIATFESMKVGDSVEIWTKNCKKSKEKVITPSSIRISK